MRTKEAILAELQKGHPHSIPTFRAMDEFAKEFLLAYLELNGMEEEKAKQTVDEAFRILSKDRHF